VSGLVLVTCARGAAAWMSGSGPGWRAPSSLMTVCGQRRHQPGGCRRTRLQASTATSLSAAYGNPVQVVTRRPGKT
jgi:hypothetical protein